MLNSEVFQHLKEPLLGQNSAFDMILFASALIATFIAYKIVHWLFTGYLVRLTDKTKTDLDDKILVSIRKPAKFGVLVGGLLLSLRLMHFGKAMGPWINMTVLAIIILLVAYSAAQVVNILVTSYIIHLRQQTHETIDDNIMLMVQKFINGTIWIVAVLLVMSNYGINITSAVAGLGLGGLAVAMAAKDTLANVLGGVIIFMDRPFKIGSVIEYNGEYGVVEGIGMRSLRMRTLSGFLVSIPNSKFVESGVKNLSDGNYRRVELILGLVYETTADEMIKAKEIVAKVLSETEGVLRDRDTVIYFDNFGASSLDLKIYYWTVFDWNGHIRTKDNINLSIKRRFDEAGLGFAFPTMTLDIPKMMQGIQGK